MERKRKKLTEKYRLIISSEDSFEEKISFKITRLNIFVIVGLSIFFLITFTVLLISYTSLKEYIPEFESPELRKNAIKMNFKLDSLENNLRSLELYTESMKPILVGEKSVELSSLPFTSNNEQSVFQSGITNNDSIYNRLNHLYKSINEKDNMINALNLEIKQLRSNQDHEILSQKEENSYEEELKSLKNSKLDSIFRDHVEREERFSILGYEFDKNNQMFIHPVKGEIEKDFDPIHHDFAIGITTSKQAPVRAIENGIVILVERSLENGFVIVLLHKNNYISIYKHNSKSNVAPGDKIKSGQIIANVGSLSKGLNKKSHFQFEIWKDGYPLNPKNLIKF